MRLAHSPSFRTRWIGRRGRLANLGVSRFIDVFPREIIIRQSYQVTMLFVLSPLSSARLRKNVRIVSSKQVFSPGDEEEGEILYNLRIDVGRNPQPWANRPLHLLQTTDSPSTTSPARTTNPLQTP